MLTFTCLLALSISIATAADDSTNTPAPAATPPTATPPPAPGGFGGRGNNAASDADHKHMMELLGITTVRRGRDGTDTNSPYFANYNEGVANPYPNLPDPLTLKNGQKVTSADMWWNQRRPEIVEDFDREVYGRVPGDTPAVNWEVTNTVTETNGSVAVITKRLVGHVDKSLYTNITVNIQLMFSTPANATGPVPVIMQFGGGFGGFGGFGRRGSAARMVFAEGPTDLAAPTALRAAVAVGSVAASEETTAPPGSRRGSRPWLGLCPAGAEQRAGRTTPRA